MRASLLALSFFLFANTFAVGQTEIILKEGTKFVVNPDMMYSSENVAIGQTLYFRVVQDYAISGLTFLKKESIVEGTVVDLNDKMNFGKPGKLLVQFNELTFADNTSTKNLSGYEVQGKSMKLQGIGLCLLTSPIVGVFSILIWYFIEGKPALIMRNESIEIVLTDDVKLQFEEETAPADQGQKEEKSER